MPPGVKQRGISVAQRLAIRQHARNHPHLTQLQLRGWFKSQFHRLITQPTISESLSAKFAHLDNNQSIIHSEQQRLRPAKYPQLEAALFEWHQRYEVEIPLSSEAIKEQARKFWRRLPQYQEMELPQFSNGWLEGFKKRHGIKQRIRHGEAASLDEAAIAEQLLGVQLAARAFNPRDIYNCDETGLFWKATPDRGLSTQQYSGTKKQKHRITAHFCCNADGSDKLPVWFIGTATHPRCFGAAQINISAFNCVYKSNTKAWMVTDLMVDWLYWFERHVGNRKVLLLMDNFSAHKVAIELIEQHRPFQNILVAWLPPNSTSKTQPLDQGIIASFKAHYRKRWLSYMLDELEQDHQPLKTVNLLKAIRWSIQAWHAVTPSTIAHCWWHSKLIEKPNLATESLLPTPVQEVAELLIRVQQQQRLQQIMSIESFLNPIEEAVVDSSEELTEQIASHYDPPELDDSDEELEVLPKVHHQQAIEAIRLLRLFEEQQEASKHTWMEQFNQYEEQLVNRSRRNQQQACITNYINVNTV